MLAMPPLRQVRIAIILLSVAVTLLVLRNNLIPLHQSSNFILFPSNYSGSKTILFGIPAYLFCTVVDAGATDISSMYSIVSSEVSSLVIFNHPNHPNLVLILFL